MPDEIVSNWLFAYWTLKANNNKSRFRVVFKLIYSKAVICASNIIFFLNCYYLVNNFFPKKNKKMTNLDIIRNKVCYFFDLQGKPI